MDTKEVSVTVTLGTGSEKHNHDLEYRSKLDHVQACENGVVELVPYVDYHEQINRIMRPYIEQYNTRAEERYDAALERYRTGERKSKPRKTDYAKMSYDYSGQYWMRKFHNRNTGRMEDVPLVRSMIIGIGDMQDRVTGRITDDQAIAIFTTFTNRFHTIFPLLHILGASYHRDEKGFFHLQLDMFPLAEKTEWETGLPVSISLDKAIEQMGYLPEQSIITKSEKAPLYFNALRNRAYKIMEAAMAKQGLRLQYGVTQRKNPYKDPSKHVEMTKWQEEQQRIVALQHYKNEVLDILAKPSMQVMSLESALKVIQEINDVVKGPEKMHHLVLLKGYEVTDELLSRFVQAADYVLEDKMSAVRSVQEQSIALQDTVNNLETERDKLCKRLKDLSLDITEKEKEYVGLDGNISHASRLLANLQSEIKEQERILTSREVAQVHGKRGMMGQTKLSTQEWIHMKNTASYVDDVRRENQTLTTENMMLKQTAEQQNRLVWEYQQVINEINPTQADRLITLVRERAEIPWNDRQREIEQARLEQRQMTMDEVRIAIQQERARQQTQGNQRTSSKTRKDDRPER